MDFLTGNNDAGTLGLGLLIAGTAAGLFTGMLGFGGGLILVPVLYHLLGEMGVSAALRLHLAAGTALASLLPTMLAALSGPLKDKTVDTALVKRWSVPLLAGVGGGAVLAFALPGELLALLFGVVAMVMALFVLLGKERWRVCEAVPSGIGAFVLPFGAGGIAMLMGISGASLFAPALRLMGRAPQTAGGTATAFAVLICAAGAVASAIAGWSVYELPRYSYGYVNLMGFGIVAPVLYAASRISAHYASEVEAKRPRATFALFVILMAGKMVWDVVG